MNKCLLLCFLLFPGLLFGQGTVTGRVMSAGTHESLIGVTVLANDTAVAITDSDGNYSAVLPAGKHTMVFKMIGMTDRKETVEVKDDATVILIIMMQESAKELGLIVVSAGKYEQRIEEVTVSMNVIKPSLIEAKNTTNMEEIIDQSPSVNIIDGQANIRGGSGWSYGAGSRVAILVDDLPMLTADANDAKWDFIPVENVEQVEILKGASSVLFGSSAMDGIINVRTAYPKDTPQTRLNFYSGMYDTKQEIELNDRTYDLNWSGKNPQKISGFNFLHSRRIRNFDFVAGGQLHLDGGYRLGEFANRSRINFNTRYRFKSIEGLSCGVNFNTMKSKENVFFIWQNDTTGAYLPLGGTDTATTTLSELTKYRTNVDPFITYAGKNGNALKLRTRFFRSHNITNTNQNTKADFYYGELQYQKIFSEKYTTSAGAVSSFSKVNSETYGNHDGDNLAFYAQAEAKIWKLTFSAGARYEKFRIDSANEDNAVFRGGLNYHIVGETYLRASYGQGYRYPSIAERYVNTNVGSLNIFPNDSLKSEKGYSAEIGVIQGLKLGGWKGYFDAAAFYTEYSDMIEFTFSIWAPSQTFLKSMGFKGLNIGDTRVRGLDFSLSGTGPIGPLQVSVLAGYTYMEPQALSYDSSYIKAQHVLDNPLTQYSAYLGSDSTDFLKYRFNHLAKADIEISYNKFALGAGMRYNSFMKNIDKLFVTPFLGDQISPGVRHYRESHRKGDYVYDARASYQVTTSTKFSAIIKNVFNHIYMQRPADMQPPRIFMAQVTVAF
jgi:outer membrane receptor protein involved in Fe transport